MVKIQRRTGPTRQIRSMGQMKSIESTLHINDIKKSENVNYSNSVTEFVDKLLNRSLVDTNLSSKVAKKDF